MDRRPSEAELCSQQGGWPHWPPCRWHQRNPRRSPPTYPGIAPR